MCVRAHFFLPGVLFACLQAGPWRGRGGAHFTVVFALSVICLTNGTPEDNCNYYVLLDAEHYVRFSVYCPSSPHLTLHQPRKAGVRIMASALQVGG